MKYLLRVLFVLALFFGVSSHARAAAVDFHVQVLDPNVCNSGSGQVAKCLVGDPTSPIPVTLDGPTCGTLNLPATTLPQGCLVIENDTLNVTITSFLLSFDATGVLAGLTFDCPNDLNSSPTPTFTSCAVSTDGSSDEFIFSGGTGVPPNGGEFAIVETGLPAGDFTGTAMVGITPEPDSLLLLSTGAMMMAAGLFLKRQRGFAFWKK
jgi:hypothetical protein